MPNTYTPIASNTLSASTASITFSAIPNSFTDLVLRMSVRCDEGTIGTNVYALFNGQSIGTSGYAMVYMQGNGTDAATSVNTNNGAIRIGAGSTGTGSTTATFSNAEMYIPNYAISQNKPMASFGVGPNNNTSALVSASANVWSNTATITQIQLLPNNLGNFLTGSSFYLYGISKS